MTISDEQKRQLAQDIEGLIDSLRKELESLRHLTKDLATRLKIRSLQSRMDVLIYLHCNLERFIPLDEPTPATQRN